jgi:hypothetical protein
VPTVLTHTRRVNTRALAHRQLSLLLSFPIPLSLPRRCPRRCPSPPAGGPRAEPCEARGLGLTRAARAANAAAVPPSYHLAFIGFSPSQQPTARLAQKSRHPGEIRGRLSGICCHTPYTLVKIHHKNPPSEGGLTDRDISLWSLSPAKGQIFLGLNTKHGLGPDIQ